MTTRLLRRPRGRQTDEGSSVVEAVIVVPVVMLLLLVAVQFALWMHATQVVQLAASEGDRSARSLGGGPVAGVTTARRVVDSGSIGKTSRNSAKRNEPGYGAGRSALSFKTLTSYLD